MYSQLLDINLLKIKRIMTKTSQLLNTFKGVKIVVLLQLIRVIISNTKELLGVIIAYYDNKDIHKDVYNK